MIPYTKNSKRWTKFIERKQFQVFPNNFSFTIYKNVRSWKGSKTQKSYSFHKCISKRQIEKTHTIQEKYYKKFSFDPKVKFEINQLFLFSIFMIILNGENWGLLKTFRNGKCFLRIRRHLSRLYACDLGSLHWCLSREGKFLT